MGVLRIAPFAAHLIVFLGVDGKHVGTIAIPVGHIILQKVATLIQIGIDPQFLPKQTSG